MGRGDKFTDVQVSKALAGTGGILTDAAKRLGSDVRTVRRYIEKYPMVAAAYEVEVETLLDSAENVIRQAIENGDVKTAQWYLTKKGISRGYGDQRMLTGPGGGPVKVQQEHVVRVMIPDNGRLRVNMLSDKQRQEWEQSVQEESVRLVNNLPSNGSRYNDSEDGGDGAGEVVDGEFELIPTDSSVELEVRQPSGHEGGEVLQPGVSGNRLPRGGKRAIEELIKRERSR